MAIRNYVIIILILLLIVGSIVLFQYKLIEILWLKRAIEIIVIIAVAAMTLAVVIFPGLKPIKTTGSYAYQSETVQFTDESRMETFLEDGSFRKLSVLVYYPDDTGIQKASCPLIVFSHGGMSFSTSNESLYQELASHGYVVVSISHTYHALSTNIDGKTIRIDSGFMQELNREDSNKDIENSYQCYQKWMHLRTDDINFVLDFLIDKTINTQDTYYSLINIDKIGAVGHSLGGAAVLGAARQRSDIQAVISLESPFMCDITGVDNGQFIWNTEPYQCAIFNIYSDTGYPLVQLDNKYEQNKAYLYNNERVKYFYLEGSNHFSLTDLVRTSPIVCAILGGGYKTSGYETLKTLNEKCVSFFNSHLK